MACRLVGAKPLSETMLEYCQLDSWEQSQRNFNWNSNIFIQENAFENVVCEMASICLGLNVLSVGIWCDLDYRFEGTIVVGGYSSIDSGDQSVSTMQKQPFLTHWGRYTMDDISQTTFSNSFSWMKSLNSDLNFTAICSWGSN